MIEAELAKRNGSDDALEAAVKSILKGVVTKHRRVVFDGDNYGQAWHEEAERSAACPTFARPPTRCPRSRPTSRRSSSIALGVLSERELEARIEVLYEQYNTVMQIEAATLLSMLRTEVLPATLRYQTELARAVSATRDAGIDPVRRDGRTDGVRRGRHGASRGDGRSERGARSGVQEFPGPDRPRSRRDRPPRWRPRGPRRTRWRS